MFDIESFVADCRVALTETQPTLATKAVVERAISDPGAIDDAVGVPGEGGFHCWYRADDLTVLQFVWPAGVELFPHDHRMWAANGIYQGVEDNAFFRRTEHRIEPAGGRSLHAGDVALLGADMIHAVTNPARSYTAAIHVYGGDFFGTPRSQWDPETLSEAPFDIEDVRRVLTAADQRAREAR